MKEQELNEEIQSYKRINSRNNIIIAILLAILVIVCVIAVYVRFFS